MIIFMQQLSQSLVYHRMLILVEVKKNDVLSKVFVCKHILILFGLKMKKGCGSCCSCRGVVCSWRGPGIATAATAWRNIRRATSKSGFLAVAEDAALSALKAPTAALHLV